MGALCKRAVDTQLQENLLHESIAILAQPPEKGREFKVPQLELNTKIDATEVSITSEDASNFTINFPLYTSDPCEIHFYLFGKEILDVREKKTLCFRSKLMTETLSIQDPEESVMNVKFEFRLPPSTELLKIIMKKNKVPIILECISKIRQAYFFTFQGKRNNLSVALLKHKLIMKKKDYEIVPISKTRSCVNCRVKDSEILLQPCNHLCLCKHCAIAYNPNDTKCPICEITIESHYAV